VDLWNQLTCCGEAVIFFLIISEIDFNWSGREEIS